MVSGDTRLGTSTLWTLFGGHPLKLERYREDYHDPCARMTRKNREWYRTFCINGHLHYPNDIDRSLNETVTDKIRKYRTDYNNNPPNTISFMSAVASTSGRLHSEFVCLLFLQVHRETDLFFASSGVQLEKSTSGQFHLKRSTFSSS